MAGSFDGVDDTGGVLGMWRTDGGADGGDIILTVRSSSDAGLSRTMIDSSGTARVMARRGGSTGFADA